MSFTPWVARPATLMSATAILDELKKHVRPADLPNLKQLTMALRQCRFLRGAVEGRHGWYAKRREEL